MRYRRRYGRSYILSSVFLLIMISCLAFVLESCAPKTKEKADLYNIITMPNHPKLGDPKEYVEEVWGKWMRPFWFGFTSYQPNVYLSDDEEVASISLSFNSQQPHALNGMTISLADCGIDFSLDEAIEIAKSYIDYDFLYENYYLSESRRYTHPNGAGEYYQDYVWKDSNNKNLPFPGIVIRFYHDSRGVIHSLSFTHKEPRAWYQNDDRIFSDWDYDLWQ